MAPRSRGRPRKGQTRKDAAIDAMKSYGFPEELIVETIGELLDVYGLEGWPFIEETAYKVLLENLLEKVEKQEKHKENEKECPLVLDNQGVDSTLVSPAGSSITAPGPTTRSNREAFLIELPQEAESGVTEVLETAKRTEESVSNAHSSNAKREGCSRKEMNAKQDHNKNKTDNVQGTEDHGSSYGPSKCYVEFEKEEDAAKASLKLHRRPYHGWISDNDEPLELIELKPAKLEELFSGINVSKKRKRRWDVKPEDIIRPF
ncbi:hypothetical protein M5689_002089 [Euphorbia peplus]|nr:hypothetical protein M5689_002089 [Euphorbia peplus]